MWHSAAQYKIVQFSSNATCSTAAEPNLIWYAISGSTLWHIPPYVGWYHRNGGLADILSRRARSARAAAVPCLLGFGSGFLTRFRILSFFDSNNPRMYLGAWFRLGPLPLSTSLPIVLRPFPPSGISTNESLVENVSSRATVTFLGLTGNPGRVNCDLTGSD